MTHYASLVHRYIWFIVSGTLNCLSGNLYNQSSDGQKKWTNDANLFIKNDTTGTLYISYDLTNS